MKSNSFHPAFVGTHSLPAGLSSPGVDDFRVGAWLAGIAFISGAQKSDEGVFALEKRFGPLPEKVKAHL